jgi:hypothetical protein
MQNAKPISNILAIMRMIQFMCFDFYVDTMYQERMRGMRSMRGMRGMRGMRV